MYKTIICAIEATPEGEIVLAKAYELAKLYKSEILVVNVIPYTLLPKDYQKELQEDITPKISAISEPFDISKKRQFIKVGKPYEQICTLAEMKHADLIIIGSHSKKSLRSLLGSTASGVSHYSPCDVSLVRI